MIEVRGVTHRLGEGFALRDVTLSLDERRIGIVGANGSGKSSFARLLNGLLVPDRGEVVVDGHSTRDDPAEVRRRVGFVFQNPDHQIVMPVVEEDLAFGLKALKLPRAEAAARIDAALRRFGLEAHREQPAHTLSGGQKQLLAIAGVLVMEPRIVVFDEPTTLLDLRNRRLVGAAVAGLDQQVVAVSHDLDWMAGFDRVIVFDEGRILADDAPGPALARYVEAML